MTTSFAVSWDYRCPFARIGHQHVLAGLRDGADWDVHFLPFSLGQMHVEEGRPDVWDDPTKETGLLALQVGTVVRDQFPDHFDGVHQGLFDARHVDCPRPARPRGHLPGPGGQRGARRRGVRRHRGR